MENNNIGKRIAILRKKNGWSQLDLAQKLNVTDKAISKWENGGSPSVDLFPKLSKLFGVSIDYLMLGDGNDDSETSTAADYAEATDEVTEDLDFESSIKNLTLYDLDLILHDQMDLYTEEELQMIKARRQELLEAPVDVEETEEDEDESDESDLEEEVLKREMALEEERKKIAISKLPKNLYCPKCDGLNPEPGQYCEDCELDFLSHFQNYQSNEKQQKTDNSGCAGYLLALLFPLIGLIWGAVKGNKSVIIFSIIMMLLSFLTYALLQDVFLGILLG